jgi:ribosomal protein L24
MTAKTTAPTRSFRAGDKVLITRGWKRGAEGRISAIVGDVHIVRYDDEGRSVEVKAASLKLVEAAPAKPAAEIEAAVEDLVATLDDFLDGKVDRVQHNVCLGSGDRHGIDGTPGDEITLTCLSCKRRHRVTVGADGGAQLPLHRAAGEMAQGQVHVVGDRVHGWDVTTNLEYTGVVAEVIPPVRYSGQYGPRYRLVDTGRFYAKTAGQAAPKPIEPIVQVTA